MKVMREFKCVRIKDYMGLLEVYYDADAVNSYDFKNFDFAWNPQYSIPLGSDLFCTFTNGERNAFLRAAAISAYTVRTMDGVPPQLVAYLYGDVAGKGWIWKGKTSEEFTKAFTKAGGQRAQITGD